MNGCGEETRLVDTRFEGLVKTNHLWLITYLEITRRI